MSIREDTDAAESPRADVARRLREMAQIDGTLAQLRADMTAAQADLARRHAGPIDMAEQQLAVARRELEHYCRAHRSELLPSGKKSLSTPFGRVGFRRGEPGLAREDHLTDADVCVRLKVVGLDHLVRAREVPDRVLALRELRAGRLEPLRLARCGLIPCEPTERFYCAPAGGAAAGRGH